MSNLFSENPYLYSNQLLRPTNVLYKVYAGVKGDIDESIKYEAEGSFSKAENLYFYMRNPYDLTISSNLKPYNRLNTFNAVYDDGNIITVKGALQYLPDYKIGLDGNYKTLEDKLKFEAKLFFTGERKSNYFYYEPVSATIKEGITTLDSYVDLNLSASYKLINNFSIFINGTNLFSKNYERFQGYKVLGAQVMGGVLVQF